MKVTLLAYTPFPETVVAAAAKGCYSSKSSDALWMDIEEDMDGPGVGAYLGGVIKSGHTSTIEHAVFTFSIEGISRACSHQLVRHRIASFSQQSQRYVEFGFGGNTVDDMFVTPPHIEANVALKEKYRALLLEAINGYYDVVDALKAAGRTQEQANEDARFLLPNAAKTNLTVTMNSRSLFNFFNLRMCHRAQWEIQELAVKMFELCYVQAPNIFKFAGPGCAIDVCKEGKHACGNPYPKR
jgi:thymidylate synthase (FAD)